jgi:predicted Fe-S protein YdhL (DUF1289 family)
MVDETDASGSNVPTPCIRNCCLDEDDVCTGCNRTMSEIIHWSEAGNIEKREILARCQLRYEQRLVKIRERSNRADRLRDDT